MAWDCPVIRDGAHDGERMTASKRIGLGRVHRNDSQVDRTKVLRKPVVVEVTSGTRPPVPKPAPPDPKQPVEVSLTKFTDFILKTGTAKLTVVKEAKAQNDSDYDPMTDFYKRLREGIIAFHVEGKEKKALDAIMSDIRHTVKLKNFPDFIGGYKKFLGRKVYKWFAPPRGDWKHGELIIRINPELGLSHEHGQMAVKLYLRAQGELDKRRAALITQVMRAVLADGAASSMLCVLDVKNGKGFTAAEDDPSVLPVLRGEALSFVEMYRSL